MTMLPASASSGDRRSPPPTSGSSTRSSGPPAWEAASRLGCSPSPQTWCSSTPAAPCCCRRGRGQGAAQRAAHHGRGQARRSLAVRLLQQRSHGEGTQRAVLVEVPCFAARGPSVLGWSRHGGTCWRGGNGTWRNGPATATRRQPRSSARSAHLATSGRGRRPATHLRGWDGSSDNSPSSPRLRR